MAFRTEKDARAWAALVERNPDQALAALAAPPDQAPPATVAEAVERHISLLTGVEPGTRASYRRVLARHIEPHRLGSRLAATATRADVAAWVTWLHEDKGLSGKTIANVHGLLSAAMNTAVGEGVRGDNPCRGMRLPRTSHTEQEMVFLTGEEFARLLELVDPRYRPFVLTLVSTGMRFGEATALRVGDVDPASRSIHVRRAWKVTGEGGQRRLGPTKTRRSDRTVATSQANLDALAPLMAGRAHDDLLFVNARGGRITQSTFWTRVWSPAVQTFAGDEVEVSHDAGGREVRTVITRGEGKHPRVHDLRHTFASWAIRSGVPLPVIQRQLGHESITTTVDRYGHLARADFDALADAVARQITPSVAGAIEPPAAASTGT